MALMTLDKFIEEQQINIYRFRLQWAGAMDLNPEDYPSEMDFQDWGMYYIAWLEQEFGRKVDQQNETG